MKIAVIGSGISGLTAAYELAAGHEVTLYEAADRLGGHTHTIELDWDGKRLALDTGFLVYNERTYPNFSRLLRQLGVATQPSDMSFSVRSDRTGWEYCGSSLAGLFAQRRNLVRPAFYRMLLDVLRFNAHAPRVMASDRLSLGQYLDQSGYSLSFLDNYLLPMAAAIWSAPPSAMRQFPLRSFVQFFANHGLLSLTDRPQWRTVTGGSARYIEAMQRSRPWSVRLASPVDRLLRQQHEVVVVSGEHAEAFDRVVVAVHADQALRMLDAPTPTEREVLGAFQYQRNEACLHTDSEYLPRRRAAWASWNYHVPRDLDAPASVTYWLNRLQRLDVKQPLCVTLNSREAINPSKVLREITYHHPLFDAAALAAQRRWQEISGQRLTHYCGAHWGYGFHEDGVNSALAVVQQIDKGNQRCTAVSTKAGFSTAASARTTVNSATGCS